MRDRTKLGLILAIFLAARFLPVESSRLQGALMEAFAMLHEYARDHVLLCLVPAFFIAGAISVFVSQASVMKYLGARASKWVAYPVAAVSGTILAVCSCTVLPLFSGIHGRGAGLGTRKTVVYVALVVVLSTAVGLVYGSLFARS